MFNRTWLGARVGCGEAPPMGASAAPSTCFLGRERYVGRSMPAARARNTFSMLRAAFWSLHACTIQHATKSTHEQRLPHPKTVHLPPARLVEANTVGDTHTLPKPVHLHLARLAEKAPAGGRFHACFACRAHLRREVLQQSKGGGAEREREGGGSGKPPRPVSGSQTM